jgi:2-polyprenyl-3-methyl-5-hydroxy-6-metoxy-1,4-benzoquinol methylase
MDQPGLDVREHQRALAALARVNLLSLTARSLAAELAAFQARGQLSTLRVLDIACGGGDVARALAHARPDWHVSGCDLSPTAVEYASAQGLPGGEGEGEGGGGSFFVHDALGSPIPTGYDALTCSLFVHHLDTEQTLTLFTRLRDSEAQCIVLSDLERCRAGLWSAYLITRLLTRSPVVHYDGPVSVRAAYTLPEIARLLRQAGFQGAYLRRAWPFRWLMTWERP